MQENFSFSKSDRLLTACSIFYVTLPVIIFALGWVRYYYSIPIALILCYFMYSIYDELASQNVCVMSKGSAKFWLITCAALLFWVFLSGIGGLGFQNWDFTARNPIYHDLCNYKWPVVYDLSLQSENVRAITGEGFAALSYYFGWWLPPALIAKIFSLGYTGQEAILYFWAVMGVFLITYNLCRFFRKNSYIIPVLFIFFSGLDV
ncbi:MAG: hypothetical protein IJT21_05790, partial [Synergistaceae bacterium]|nr:hypothetical protein [Synergistaceae bacterium]